MYYRIAPASHKSAPTIYYSAGFKIFILRSQTPGSDIWDSFNIRAEHTFSVEQADHLKEKALAAAAHLTLELTMTRKTENLLVRDGRTNRITRFPLARLGKEVRDQIGYEGAADNNFASQSDAFNKHLPGYSEQIAAPMTAKFKKKTPPAP